jgi:hypothetical protein
LALAYSSAVETEVLTMTHLSGESDHLDKLIPDRLRYALIRRGVYVEPVHLDGIVDREEEAAHVRYGCARGLADVAHERDVQLAGDWVGQRVNFVEDILDRIQTLTEAPFVGRELLENVWVQTFRNASLFRSRDQQPLTRSLVHDDDAPWRGF